jgi:hypothetical protein
MTVPSDGWDRDERDALALPELAADLEATRARHGLAPEDENSLLARIQRDALTPAKPHTARSWQWGFVLAAAGIFLIVGAVWMLRQDNLAVLPGAAPESTVAVAKPPPAFVLPLETLDIKVSPAALAWRGPKGDNTLLADLKPAFDAIRSRDYALADREFAAVSGKYPGAVEIAVYQGVARLFLGNIPGAIENLTAAEKLADRSFAWDVAWYRAVAEERGGNIAGARTRLTSLCAQPDARAKTACDALARLR